MTIVAPVDRSKNRDRIIKEARTLANSFNEDLHIIHVLQEQEYYKLDRIGEGKRHEIVHRQEIEDTAREIAREAALENEVRAEAVGLVGDVTDEIIKYSQEKDARFIVIGSRKRSPTGKAIFGSAGQSILLNAKQPVVSVPENQ